MTLRALPRRGRTCVGILLITALGMGGNFARADETQSIGVPSDTKFVLEIDLQEFQRTDLGERFLELAKQEVIKEIGEKHHQGDDDDRRKEPDFEQIDKMLGFDPFTDIQGVRISASDYEHPEKSLIALVRMKETTGNLEGLLLSLPEYEVTDYRKYRVHSACPDGDLQLHVAIHTDRSGSKTIVLAPRRSAVEMLLDQLDGHSSRNDEMESISLDSRQDGILQLQILDFPDEMLGEGPQANVAKILKHLTLRLNEDDDDVSLALGLTAKDGPQAEQILQMSQGLIAMINFAKSADPDDEDLQKFSELVQELRATRDGDEVQVELSVDSDELMKLIEEELN